MNRVNEAEVAETHKFKAAFEHGIGKLTLGESQQVVVKHAERFTSSLRADPGAGLSAAQARATGNTCPLCRRQFPSFLQLQKHARGCTQAAPFPRPPREKGTQRPKRGRSSASGIDIINTTKHMFTEPLPSLPEAAVLDTVRGKELLALCASFRQHSVDAVGKLAAILEPLEANLAHFADEVQDIAEEVVSVQEPANAVPSQGSRQRLDTIIDRAHDVAADLAPWRTQAGHAHQALLNARELGSQLLRLPLRVGGRMQDIHITLQTATAPIPALRGDGEIVIAGEGRNEEAEVEAGAAEEEAEAEARALEDELNGDDPPEFAELKHEEEELETEAAMLSDAVQELGAALPDLQGRVETAFDILQELESSALALESGAEETRGALLDAALDKSCQRNAPKSTTRVESIRIREGVAKMTVSNMKNVATCPIKGCGRVMWRELLPKHMETCVGAARLSSGVRRSAASQETAPLPARTGRPLGSGRGGAPARALSDPLPRTAVKRRSPTDTKSRWMGRSQTVAGSVPNSKAEKPPTTWKVSTTKAKEKEKEKEKESERERERARARRAQGKAGGGTAGAKTNEGAEAAKVTGTGVRVQIQEEVHEDEAEPWVDLLGTQRKGLIARHGGGDYWRRRAKAEPAPSAEALLAASGAAPEDSEMDPSQQPTSPGRNIIYGPGWENGSEGAAGGKGGHGAAPPMPRCAECARLSWACPRHLHLVEERARTQVYPAFNYTVSWAAPIDHSKETMDSLVALEAARRRNQATMAELNRQRSLLGNKSSLDGGMQAASKARRRNDAARAKLDEKIRTVRDMQRQDSATTQRLHTELHEHKEQRAVKMADWLERGANGTERFDYWDKPRGDAN